MFFRVDNIILEQHLMKNIELLFKFDKIGQIPTIKGKGILQDLHKQYRDKLIENYSDIDKKYDILWSSLFDIICIM